MSKKGKVKELIKWLNVNLDLYEIPKYQITETSKRKGVHTYTIRNLEAKIEDVGVYFEDVDEIIHDNQYALMGFLIESIADITLENKVVTVRFESNGIKIELI